MANSSSFSKAFAASFEKAMADRTRQAERDRERKLDKEEKDEYRRLDKEEREAFQSRQRSEHLSDVDAAHQRQIAAALAAEQAVNDRTALAKRQGIKERLLTRGAAAEELETYQGPDNDYALSLLDEAVTREYGEGRVSGRLPGAKEALDKFTSDDASTSDEYKKRIASIPPDSEDLAPAYVAPGIGNARAAGIRASLEDVSQGDLSGRLAEAQAQKTADIHAAANQEADAAKVRATAARYWEAPLDFSGLDSAEATKLGGQYEASSAFRAKQVALNAKQPHIDVGGRVGPDWKVNSWYSGGIIPPEAAAEVYELEKADQLKQKLKGELIENSFKDMEEIKNALTSRKTSLFTDSEVKSMLDENSEPNLKRIGQLRSLMRRDPTATVGSDNKETWYYTREKAELPPFEAPGGAPGTRPGATPSTPAGMRKGQSRGGTPSPTPAGSSGMVRPSAADTAAMVQPPSRVTGNYGLSAAPEKPGGSSYMGSFLEDEQLAHERRMQAYANLLGTPQAPSRPLPSVFYDPIDAPPTNPLFYKDKKPRFTY